MKSRRAWPVLLVGIALISAIAWAGPRTAPPVYDGLCVAEPYLAFPPKEGARPAPGITKTVDLTRPTAAQTVTPESPPQVQVIVPANALTGTITFDVQPVKPPGQAPPNGSIDGNVYRISATSPGGTVKETQQPMSIVLRSPEAAAGRVVDVYANGRWTAIETVPIGCAFQWLANTTQFGDYALVNPAAPEPAPPTSRGARVFVVSAGVIIGLIACTITAIRLVRTRRQT